MKPVLFAGTRPYGRAENISALYDAYQGKKKFIQVSGDNNHPDITSGNYDILVIDDFPSKSPGKCIMLWHAIQGGKHIGFDQNEPYVTPEKTAIIDYIIAAGHGAIPMWSQCARMPQDKILPLGMPRTDGFKNKMKGDGHTLLAKKRAYLYAPTFRWGNEPANFNLDQDWLDEQLTDDELFVIKPHMAGKSLLKRHYKHIIEVGASEPSSPYLYDCDVVITDYSSIIFDGYLLNKPAILFEKTSGYTDIRGMYLKYPERYCSNYVTNEKDLLEAMRNVYDLTNIEKTVINYVADMCDGHSCERICKLIAQL